MGVGNKQDVGGCKQYLLPRWPVFGSKGRCRVVVNERDEPQRSFETGLLPRLFTHGNTTLHHTTTHKHTHIDSTRQNPLKLVT